MANPTREQIQEEIEKLKELKPKVRHHTAFGDDNRAAIGAEIKVMEMNLGEDEIYDRYEDYQHSLDAALYARYWLDGHEKEAPSVGWEPLAQ